MKDTELQQHVLDELEWRPDIHAAQIGVTANNAIVTLTGYVPSYAEKYEAEQAAKKVDGVRGVVEHLEVRYGTDAMSDEEIAKRAVNSLSWNALVPRNSVRVMVENGWLTLSGQVTWQFQRAVAESTVRGLTGVRGVTNSIVLASQPQPADLKAQIEGALERKAEVDSDAIEVKVENGVVILEGTVDSWTAREEAESTAWSAPGVRDVQDLLRVANPNG